MRLEAKSNANTEKILDRINRIERINTHITEESEKSILHRRNSTY